MGIFLKKGHKSATSRRYKELLALIDEMEAAKRQLADIEIEASALSDRTKTLGRRQGLLRGQIGDFQKIRSQGGRLLDYDRPNSSRLPEEEAAAQEKLECVLQELVPLEQELEKVRGEEEALKATIAKCEASGIGQAELIAHQEALDAARKTLAEFDELIASQDIILSSASEGDEERIESLQSRREDLLADIALGKAGQSDLDVLDQELESLLVDKSGDEAKRTRQYRQAYQTAAGLRRRRKDTEQALAELESKTRVVMELFVRQECNGAAGRYLEAARNLVESTQQLYTLDKLLRVATGRKGSEILPHSCHRMFLPAFNAPCFRDHHDKKNNEDSLFSFGDLEKLAADLLEAERQRLKKLGLDDFLVF